MLEDNEMKFLVDALNVMPNKTVLVPKFFQDPMSRIQHIAEIRFILTKAIGATDKPHIYKITIQGTSGELGIRRNDELLSPQEEAQRIVDMEYKRLSEVDPWFLENYEKTWETDENDE